MTEQRGGRLDEEAEGMVFRGLCSDIYLLCDLGFGKRRGIGEKHLEGNGLNISSRGPCDGKLSENGLRTTVREINAF